MKKAISKSDRAIKGRIRLAGSKSISNRVLLIRALCEKSFDIHHLANAKDTELLHELLQGAGTIYDAGPAGTTYRFLTAYLSLQEGTQILTGSERMKQRPIGILVDALRHVGAEIEYLEKEGFPPLRIKSGNKIAINKPLTIDAGVSSQYISALLLIAPSLPNGLTLDLDGDVVSVPYIQMTLNIMEYFGIEYTWDKNRIVIPSQVYKERDFTVEADWSAASYYYEMVALASEADLYLDGLQKESLQGDAAIVQIMEHFGVKTTFTGTGIHLTKVAPNRNILQYDFVNCPDLAQTVVVTCAATDTKCKFTGLKTLRIKETDRIAALNAELKKVGSSFEPCFEKDCFAVQYRAEWSDTPVFSTYEDHRMAMAFAPLALLGRIEVEDWDVVGKSYPEFWNDLKKIGFHVA